MPTLLDTHAWVWWLAEARRLNVQSLWEPPSCMPANGRVTIVILTLNGGILLERMLDAVDAQDAACEREFVATRS